MARPKRFEEFEEKAVKDYDPEADSAGENDQSGSGSGSEDEGADLAGTEHYLNVGKSKLRQKENVSLGPQYRGSRVSRQALEDSDEGSEDFEDAQEDFDSDAEEYDDPETADLAVDQARAEEDAEISSDDALGDSDDEKLDKFVFRGSSKPHEGKDKKDRKKRPTAADFISGSEDEEGEEQDDDSDGSGGVDLMDVEAEEESGESGSGDEDEEDEDEEGDSDLDGFINDDSGLEDEDEDDEDASGSEDDDEDEDDEALKPKKSSRAADARAEQRKLMNEGQKALVATISAAVQQDAAKGLAVRQQRKTFDGLLNIRIRLQKALVATNSFSAFDAVGDDEAEPYSAAEEAALKLLGTLDSVRATLVPSASTSSSSSAPDKKRKRDTSTEALWAALQETDARAAKHRRKVLDTWSSKTRNATVEVKSRNLISSQQSLVASLEDQLLNSDRLIKRARTPRSCAPVQVAAKVNEDASVYDDADFYQLLLKELVEQRTSDETAAQASGGALATGRKMQFNIHEKLQNFMAPEDRRAWEQEAIDRLFGTLFGQRMVLAEAEGEDEEMEDGNAEEEGLRLFRS
ncbi:Protein bfr2 like protein [Verticillium longisporum]|nr:Protein bfr2 like protein [Verticillium longisporum]